MDKPEDRIILDNIYQVGELVNKLINEAQAWRETAKRLGDAHNYVQKYLLPEGWGKNVWHSILDDAIRMRNNGMDR